jgi:GNAT superfamily N-acetyltransferase
VERLGRVGKDRAMTDSGSAGIASRAGVLVRAEDVHGADAAMLLRAYFTEIVTRYHGREAPAAEVDAAMADEPSTELVPPGGLFLVLRAGARPLGCVGLRLLPPEIAEVKRMFVLPSARGQGAGSALLAAAEEAGRRLGARALRLDTRTDLVEARALYARSGFVEIPAYNEGPYAQHWFEKRLPSA